MLRSSLFRITLLNPFCLAITILLLPLSEQQNLLLPSVTQYLVFTSSLRFTLFPFTQGGMLMAPSMSAAAPNQMIRMVGSIDQCCLLSSSSFTTPFTKASFPLSGMISTMWLEAFPLMASASLTTSFIGLPCLRKKVYCLESSLKVLSLLCWCFTKFLKVFRKWFLKRSASFMLEKAKTDPTGAQSRLLDLMMRMVFLLKLSTSLERKILQAISFFYIFTIISAFSLQLLNRSLAQMISPSFFLRIWQQLIFSSPTSLMYCSSCLASESSRYSLPMSLILLPSGRQLNFTSENSFWMSALLKCSSVLLAMILSATLTSFSPILFCAVKMLLSSLWVSSMMKRLVTQRKDFSIFSTTTQIFSIFSQVNLSMVELNLYSAVMMSPLILSATCARTMLLKCSWFSNFTLRVSFTTVPGNSTLSSWQQLWKDCLTMRSAQAFTISRSLGCLLMWVAMASIFTWSSSLLSSVGSLASASTISLSFSSTRFFSPSMKKSQKYSEVAIFFSKVYFFSTTQRHIWFSTHLGDRQPAKYCTVSTSSLAEKRCTSRSLYFSFLSRTITTFLNLKQTSSSAVSSASLRFSPRSSRTLQVEMVSSLQGSLLLLVLMHPDSSYLVFTHCSKFLRSNSEDSNTYSFTRIRDDSPDSSLFSSRFSSRFSFFLYFLPLLATLTLSSSVGSSKNFLWPMTTERVAQKLGSVSSSTISTSSEELEGLVEWVGRVGSAVICLWMAAMLSSSLLFLTRTRKRFSVLMRCCSFLASSCSWQCSTMDLMPSSSTFLRQILMPNCCGRWNYSSSMSTSSMFFTTFIEYSSISARIALISSSHSRCGPRSCFSLALMVMLLLLTGSILKSTRRRYSLKVYSNLNSLLAVREERSEYSSLVLAREWRGVVLEWMLMVELEVEGTMRMVELSSSLRRQVFFLGGSIGDNQIVVIIDAHGLLPGVAQGQRLLARLHPLPAARHPPPRPPPRPAALPPRRHRRDIHRLPAGPRPPHPLLHRGHRPLRSQLRQPRQPRPPRPPPPRRPRGPPRPRPHPPRRRRPRLRLPRPPLPAAGAAALPAAARVAEGAGGERAPDGESGGGGGGGGVMIINMELRIRRWSPRARRSWATARTPPWPPGR